MARTLAAIIREMKMIETSTMKPHIKAFGLAKLQAEAEAMAGDGELKEPETDPRQGLIPGADTPKGKR